MKKTLLLVLAAAAAPLVFADQIFDVTLNTTGLVGSPLAPFQLDFQLTNGDGVSNNNRITLSNFAFGAGGSGTLPASVILDDTGFLNTFTGAFTPGDLLSFRLRSTTNFGGGTPDQFNFAILDQFGNFLPTSFFDVFVSIDIAGAPLIPSTGSNALTGAPTLTPVAPPPAGVPEPGTLGLAAGAVVLVLIGRRRAA